MDYVNAESHISNYYPDFFVKLSNKQIIIVETKGLVDIDVPLQMERLRQWCEDINRIQTEVKYDFVFVGNNEFKDFNPTSFKELIDSFRHYKEP